MMLRCMASSASENISCQPLMCSVCLCWVWQLKTQTCSLRRWIEERIDFTLPLNPTATCFLFFHLGPGCVSLYYHPAPSWTPYYQAYSFHPPMKQRNSHWSLCVREMACFSHLAVYNSHCDLHAACEIYAVGSLVHCLNSHLSYFH